MSSTEHDLIEANAGVADAPGRVGFAEAAEFARHLEALTRSGLPMPAGLRALAEEVESRRVGAILRRTAAQLELGRPLDDVLIGLAGQFPPQLRGLIAAGTRSGRLADVLGQYAGYSELGAALRRSFRMAIAYPCLLLGMFAALYLFVSIAIVDVFRAIVKDFGIEIPFLTQVLFASADVLRVHGATLAIGSLVVCLAAWGGTRLAMTPAQRRTAWMRVPVFGTVLRNSTLAEFSHLAGLLVGADAPLPEALRLAAEGAGSSWLIAAMDRVGREVAAGASLAQAVEAWRECPSGLREAMTGGEGRGDLAGALHMAGSMFEARAQSASKLVSAAFAGLLCLLLLWGVGFLVAGLYLPIINLITKLAG